MGSTNLNHFSYITYSCSFFKFGEISYAGLEKTRNRAAMVAERYWAAERLPKEFGVFKKEERKKSTANCLNPHPRCTKVLAAERLWWGKNGSTIK